ncbi:unnamed protein product [Musa banksii]
MPEEDLVELKFRLYDGSDIGPIRYSSSSTIAMLKERIISEWPRGRSSRFLFEFFSLLDRQVKTRFSCVCTCMCIMLLVLFLSAFYGNFGSSILVHVVDYITDLYSILAVDKKIVPKVANDVKLISAGKILENSKTIAQCRSPFGEPPADGITMHVVVQPSLTKAKTEKKVEELPKKTACSCSIL